MKPFYQLDSNDGAPRKPVFFSYVADERAVIREFAATISKATIEKAELRYCEGETVIVIAHFSREGID